MSGKAATERQTPPTQHVDEPGLRPDVRREARVRPTPLARYTEKKKAESPGKSRSTQKKKKELRCLSAGPPVPLSPVPGLDRH